jgi:hypothetical protein
LISSFCIALKTVHITARCGVARVHGHHAHCRSSPFLAVVMPWLTLRAVGRTSRWGGLGHHRGPTALPGYRGVAVTCVLLAKPRTSQVVAAQPLDRHGARLTARTTYQAKLDAIA